MSLRPILLVLAGLTIATAEDRPLSDLRLHAGLGPAQEDTDTTLSALGGSTSGTTDETADSAWQVGIAYVASPEPLSDGLGLIWSIGLTSTGYEVELDDDETRRFSSIAVELGLGVAMPLGSLVHLEAAPFVALGGATGEIEYADGSDSDGEAFYWAVGARAGGFVTFDNGLQLGLELRYTYSGAKFEDEDTILGIEVESEVDVRISGVGVLASIGYRF